MHNFLRELRLAVRQVFRSPVFSAAVVLILALATGAISAVFSLLDGLWLRPLAVPHPTQIVRLFAVTDQANDFGFSYPEYRELSKQSSDVMQLIAMDRRGARVPMADGSTELVLVNGVSSNFFSALGVHAAIGRVFDPSDDNSTGPETVVLGDSYWRRTYGADPNIIGKQIKVMRGERTLMVTVIGVLPESFRELEPSLDREMWFPYRTWKEISNVENRGYQYFIVAGRLLPGVSRAKAESKLQTIAASLAQEWPDTNQGRRVRVVNDLRYRWEEAGVNGEMLLAIVGLLMMLCAVNIANLFLARGAQREHELSIRLSLGANRRQLFLHMFVESVVLGVAGVGFGLLVGRTLIHVLPSLFVPPPGLHVATAFELNRQVLLVSAAVGLLTTLLFGSFPALRAATGTKSRITPVNSTAGREGHAIRLHRWLVVTQVSISLVLLVGTGLMIRSFTNTRTANLGIARDGLLNVWITSSIPENPALRQEIEEDLAAIPGVHRVAMAVRAPLSLSGNGMAENVDIPDAPQPAGTAPREILCNMVGAKYLQVIGTPVVAGRAFEREDENTKAKVVVINQTMARRFWPNTSPIDRTLRIGTAGDAYRIVGIAKDAPIGQLGDQAVPYMYLPFATNPGPEQTFVLEYSGDPDLIAPAARARLARLDSKIVVMGMTTERELIHFAAQEYVMTAALVSALGLLAMCLTAAGLYGTVSYGVTRRMKEIGIRMALGSSRGNTMMLVMREIGWIAGIGLAIGMPISLACTRLSAAAFFGVSPWHLPTLVSMTALLVLILFIAGYGPALRASRVDPMAAIRDE